MNIGKVMLDLREADGKSRSEVARSLGITNGALWKIEKGKTLPKQKTIEKFCEEFGVPLARLYCLSFDVEDFGCLR